MSLRSTPTPWTSETTSIHLSPTPVRISRLTLALPAQLLNSHWHYQHLCQIQAGSVIQQLQHFNISRPYLLHRSSLHFHPHSLLPNISLKMPSGSVLKTSYTLFNLLFDPPYLKSPSFSLPYLPSLLVNLQSAVYSPLSSAPYAHAFLQHVQPSLVHLQPTPLSTFPYPFIPCLHNSAYSTHLPAI